MTRCLADKCPGIEVSINADLLALFQITPSVPNVGLGINKRRGTLELVDMIGLSYKEDMVHDLPSNSPESKACCCQYDVACPAQI